MNAKMLPRSVLAALLTVPLLLACKGKDTNTPVPPPQTTTPPAAATSPPPSETTTPPAAPSAPSSTAPSPSTDQGTTTSR